jgi:ring-1,2-phenylacetyl-CoA epoxidase subunit PaaC
VLAAAAVPRSEAPRRAGVLGRTGRDGMHGEPLSLMLAEMQSVARAHPRGQW